MIRKTLNDLRFENKAYLNAADVCAVLGCDPNYIRVAAREQPHLLGFPVIVMGNRVKIPRIPFLQFMGAIN